MNQEKEEKRKRLSFAELMVTAKNSRKGSRGFPYTSEICRCRYCSYCHEGKCALKICCAMAERVRGGSCSFTELLNHCFANVKDPIFHFRLRMAAEQVEVQKSCFLNTGHRKRFYEGCAMTHRKDDGFIAQLFLLSALEGLWSRVKKLLYTGGLDYADLDLKNLSEQEYLYYCTASDIHHGGSHMDIKDLSNDDMVPLDAFQAICCAVVVYSYGMDAVKISEKKPKHGSTEKRRDKGRSNDRR